MSPSFSKIIFMVFITQGDDQTSVGCCGFGWFVVFFQKGFWQEAVGAARLGF